MSRYSTHILIFLAGLICGCALMALTASTVDLGRVVAPRSERADALPAPLLEDIEQGTNIQQHVDRSLDTTTEQLSTPPPAPIARHEEVSLEIPESYRATIGPVVQHISFGEKYRDFEAEPIDGSWAYAMESGISDFIAIHGPESGEVFEFVQCRSSNCVLAGYTLLGREPSGASVIGQLSRQPWWQGGQKASSTHNSGEDRTSFVVLIPRIDE